MSRVRKPVLVAAAVLFGLGVFAAGHPSGFSDFILRRPILLARDVVQQLVALVGVRRQLTAQGTPSVVFSGRAASTVAAVTSAVRRAENMARPKLPQASGAQEPSLAAALPAETVVATVENLRHYRDVELTGSAAVLVVSLGSAITEPDTDVGAADAARVGVEVTSVAEDATSVTVDATTVAPSGTLA
jgi:hypothetical protein